MTSPSLSEVYGLRDSQLLGMATRAYPGGVWTVYLANGTNEGAFARGQCRREQAGSLNDVVRIFAREGLEFRGNKPQNIPVPDLSVFEGAKLLKSSILSDPQVAQKLGELMRAAAERKDPNVLTMPTRLPKSPLNTGPGAALLKKIMNVGLRGQLSSLPETPRVQPKAPKNGLSTNSTGARMNKKQKTVLIVVAATVVAMLVFPPFHAIRPTGIVEGLGYHLISNPPKFRIYTTDLVGTVDIGLLVAQWLAVLIVGGITFFFFKD